MSTLVTRVAVLACAAILAAGCQHRSPEPGEGEGPLTPVAVADPHVAFQILAPSSQRLVPRTPPDSGCPVYQSSLRGGDRAVVSFEVYAGTCPTTDNASPGNGRHGTYRTVADIPADRASGSTRVATPLGAAVVFEQQYYECTNSCKRWTEPVAVIALDHPVDPAYPTLVVRSDRGVLGRTAFERFLLDRLRA